MNLPCWLPLAAMLDAAEDTRLETHVSGGVQPIQVMDGVGKSRPRWPIYDNLFHDVHTLDDTMTPTVASTNTKAGLHARCLPAYACCAHRSLLHTRRNLRRAAGLVAHITAPERPWPCVDTANDAVRCGYRFGPANAARDRRAPGQPSLRPSGRSAEASTDRDGPWCEWS